MSDKQVRSKQRVADHGEVFTADREVNAMLDLVKDETERIDSRFLEPACGDGNFLAQILRRKLAVVRRRYKKSPDEFERNAVLALMSIYGVDILADNVADCRARLLDIWTAEYTDALGRAVPDDCLRTARFVLARNILCGDALSLECVDEAGSVTDEPIIFSEWSFIDKCNVSRSDYRLDVLLKENDDPDLYNDNFSLFDDAQSAKFWELDPKTNEMIPKPVRQFPPTDYRRLAEYGE